MFYTAFVLTAMVGLGARPAMASVDRAVELFPEVPGFLVSRDSTVYEPSNLWDVIDGAADLFVAYGFVDLHSAYYRADSVEIRVEVYKHDTPENAFGMYSQERSPENSYVNIGVQGYVEEGLVNFLAGPYYVKLSSNAQGSALRQSMRTIAMRIAGSLGQPASWPGALALLPVIQRVPHSEQYIAESYLGYKFLQGAYVAQFRENGLFEVFIIPAPSEAEAASMLTSLVGVNHLQLSSENPRILRDIHHGDMGLVLRGKYLAGVVHCPDGAVRSKFLEILQSSLQ
jgi:hypothetical protein